MRVNVVNIGCFKNLVDCELLIWQLRNSGVEVSFGQTDIYADIVIINTCGFISDAEKDSLAEINKYVKLKHQGVISQIWVMGCYGEKMKTALIKNIPDVDRVYGNFNWHDIIRDISRHEWIESECRIVSTPKHYAYIKISDGCNMPCSYCIKPILNGALKSRPIEAVVKECEMLAKSGVKELQIVSQNTTEYGRDLYGKQKIAELIERLSDIEGIEWIRLHYAYPVNFPRNLLDVISSRKNVCNYVDMAIQHCNEEMLRKMRRTMSKEHLIDLLDEIRSRGISIRTTVMTGHPGETEEIYQELKDFVMDRRFDRMGVFLYSHEPLSYSGINYTDEIPESVKRKRALELMAIQKDIYARHSSEMVGKRIKVIIDGKNLNGDYVGRPENSTPMADPKIIIKSFDPLVVGNFYNTIITNSLGKDMEGNI